jgi:phosphate transport system permease protein
MEIMHDAVPYPLPEAAEPTPTRTDSDHRRLKDRLARRGLWAAAVALLALIAAIAGLLVWRSLPILAAYPLGELLGGRVWQPVNGLFGFAPFIAGSFAVTGVAMVLAVVPAILSGIYLAEYTSARRRARLKPLLDLLVGIPSVVYGLWGILFVVPLIRETIGPWADATLGGALPFFRQTNPSGYGLLAGGIVLGIMVFPLIVAITDEVLRSIPREMREAALSLGATRWEATWCVVRHGAPAGIVAAVVLGFSRAFGETLAVMMVVGNTAVLPTSLFDTAYPLPALIANAYGEMMSVPLYQSALMAAALLLLVIVLIFNILARLVIVRLGRTR